MAESSDEFPCPNPECEEDIEREEDGSIPRFCCWCSLELACPKCKPQKLRKKGKKGIAKFCSRCKYVYDGADPPKSLPGVLVGPSLIPAPTFQTQSMPNIGTTSVTPSSPESKSQPSSLQARPTVPTSSSQIQLTSSSTESGSSHSPGIPVMSSPESARNTFNSPAQTPDASAVEQIVQGGPDSDNGQAQMPVLLLPNITQQLNAEHRSMSVDDSLDESYVKVPFEQAEEEEMETDRGGNEEDNDSDDGVNFYDAPTDTDRDLPTSGEVPSRDGPKSGEAPSRDGPTSDEAQKRTLETTSSPEEDQPSYVPSETGTGDSGVDSERFSMAENIIRRASGEDSMSLGLSLHSRPGEVPQHENRSDQAAVDAHIVAVAQPDSNDALSGLLNDFDSSGSPKSAKRTADDMEPHESAAPPFNKARRQSSGNNSDISDNASGDPPQPLTISDPRTATTVSAQAAYQGANSFAPDEMLEKQPSIVAARIQAFEHKQNSLNVSKGEQNNHQHHDGSNVGRMSPERSDSMASQTADELASTLTGMELDERKENPSMVSNNLNNASTVNSQSPKSFAGSFRRSLSQNDADDIKRNAARPRTSPVPLSEEPELQINEISFNILSTELSNRQSASYDSAHSSVTNLNVAAGDSIEEGTAHEFRSDGRLSVWGKKRSLEDWNPSPVILGRGRKRALSESSGTAASKEQPKIELDLDRLLMEFQSIRASEMMVSGGFQTESYSETLAGPSSIEAPNSGEMSHDNQNDPPIDAALLNAFLSWKNTLDEVRTTYLSSKSQKKSPFETNEETQLSKAAGEADLKLNAYKCHIKAIQNGSAKEGTLARGHRDTENAFKKFLERWPQKLTPILGKAGIRVEPIVAKSGHAPRNHKTAGRRLEVHPPPRGAVKQVQFKILLPNHVDDYYRNKNEEPYVTVYSTITKNWRGDRILELQKGNDGIWTGQVDIPANTEKMDYWYEIKHFGFEMFKGGNRFVTFKRGVDITTIYDGTLVYDESTTSKSLLGKVKGFFMSKDAGTDVNYLKLTKEEEMQKGILAMLPDWSADLMLGRTVYNINRTIMDVVTQQHFVAQVHLWPNDRAKGGAAINNIAGNYLMKCVETFGHRVPATEDPLYLCASLTGLMSITWYYGMWNHNARELMDMVNNCCQKIADLVHGVVPEQFATQLLNRIGGGQQYLERLSKTLCEIIQSPEMLASDIWIRLLPLIHCLAPAHYSAHHKGDYHQDSWWGLDSLTFSVSELQKNKKFSNPELWKQWAQWLSIYFNIDKLLHYSYLGLLNSLQMISLLKSPDMAIVGKDLPLFGVIAAVEYHLLYYSLDFKVSASMLSALCDYLIHLLDAGETTKMGKPVLDIGRRLVKKMFPGKPTASNVSAYEALRVNLLLLNCARAFSPEISRTETEVALKQFVKELEIGMNSDIAAKNALNKDEMKHWTALFNCTSYVQSATEGWQKICDESFRNRLKTVCGHSPMLVVDLYLDPDCGILLIDAAVVDAAFSVAEKLLKNNTGKLQGKTAKEKGKIARLLDQAFSRAWEKDMKQEHSLSIVKNLIDWENFLPIWQYFQNLTKEQQKMINPANTQRLQKAVKAVDDVMKEMKYGEMTVETFKYLSKNQERITSLCVISPQWCKGGTVGKTFREREEELDIYRKFVDDTNRFWGIFRFQVAIKKSGDINTWLNRSIEKLQLQELVHHKTKEVLAPLIPSEIRTILPEFLHLINRPIFRQQFERKALNADGRELAFVAEIHRDAVKAYEGVIEHIASGTINITQLKKLMDETFRGDKYRVLSELPHMIRDRRLCEERRRQAEICIDLQHYRTGAKVMLDLKQTFNLKGDFTDMEQILASTTDQLELCSISSGLVKSADTLKDITHVQIKCLEVFTECPDFIEWVRTEVPKKDISNFVDLANTTLGEDDLATQKIRYLRNALTGYTPLLYEFDQETMNYDQFMSKCREIWTSMEKNKDLPDNLKESARELDWLKKVKSHFGSVEIASMAQATAINETGIYEVGNLNYGYTDNCKTLDDIIRLSCHIEEKKMDGQSMELRTGKRVGKVYKYADLKDLQSRLTLVAGEKQTENKDIIQKFDSMRDDIENLAKAYLEIRREGCIQFDDLLVKVHCNPTDTTVELKLQSLDQSITGKPKSGTSERHCKELYQFLNTCVADWKKRMNMERAQNPTLNFFTTEQLVVLRRELGKYNDRGKEESLQKTLPLLAMIHTYPPAKLLEYLKEYKEETMDVDADSADNEDGVIKLDQMEPSQQDMVYELIDEAECTEEMAVLALSTLGDKEHPNEYKRWIKSYIPPAPTEEMEVELETADDVRRSLIQPAAGQTTSTLQMRLERLWNGFIERTGQTIKNYLGIPHLVYLLNKLNEPRLNQRLRIREKPMWLERGRPNLIAVPARRTYQMVLTIYAADTGPIYPTRNEVLICTKSTRPEEVEIFLSRALSDKFSFYCMVNCHLLDFEMCRYIQRRMTELDEESKVENYGLAFIYQEEVKEARIRAYLDKYLVKHTELADVDRLREYVLQMLTVPEDAAPTACVTDPKRSNARLIRSQRAGVGKTLVRDRLVTRLRDVLNITKGSEIIIPVYKMINTDAIIDTLTIELGNGYTDEPYHTIHLDIAHEVEHGVDVLLFNLILLRSIVNSEGTVWQAQHTQYYIIEAMPYCRRDGSSVHEIMDFLPMIECIAPESALQQYSQGVPEDEFQGFDKETLHTLEWQIVLKFLENRNDGSLAYPTHYGCFTQDKDGNNVPNWDEEEFLNPKAALELLIKFCGLTNPTWSELRHYVYFLSSQLIKIQNSPFTWPLSADDLPGFRSFVIKFMFRMAEDFATRSLKIAEETPGLNIESGEAGESPDLLEQLTMKRTWENSNHPYLFFNEDGATITPLGFTVKMESLAKPCDLVDANTGETIPGMKGVISRELKRALDQTEIKLSENFDKLGRQAQLMKLRSIMVKDVQLYTSSSRGGYKTRVQMFHQGDEPDMNYVLTMDNAKKLLAIHQRLRVDIPVIIMGETGCGKTKLIEFMSKLQVPTDLRGDDLITMIIVKIHGGTTEEDIIAKVVEAQERAVINRDICMKWAADHHSDQIPSIYTILFLDEANTTEAIGLVKEILCDRRIRGKPLDNTTGLKIIAACNPYRSHTPAMIEKLKKAGLGYNVSEKDTKDKFGQIPMRHLVYRVQPLPQSLLPLVWDFGTLKSTSISENNIHKSGGGESDYIKQMLIKANRQNREKKGLNFAHHTATVAEILAMVQTFMREQKDECSFVSLRDIQRLMDVANWFYMQREYLFPAMDELKRQRDNPNEHLDSYQPQTMEPEPVQVMIDGRPMTDYRKEYVARCLALALGVCYLARLEDNTRDGFTSFVGRKLERMIFSTEYGTNGPKFLNDQLEFCQNLFVKEVIDEAAHRNIAQNKALKENVFMMIVCIENRVPLFLVGKPGSSKSLSKAMVVDAMKGTGAKSEIFKKMKQTYMVSFQCSRHATPAGIVGVFNQCANFQKELDLDTFVSVVVLDEVGLAEDSENMPLKTLHPLLEDGCDGNRTPEPWMKCAFVGISNWALDPAKMNRGIFVQRGTPKDDELEQIAHEICKSASPQVKDFISPLARGYLEICTAHKPEERDLTEFFGLRDFYSLMKMVVNFAERSDGNLNRNQLEHSIKRNFGGFDPDKFDPMTVFTEHCRDKFQRLEPSVDDLPPVDSIGLIKSSLTGDAMRAIGDLPLDMSTHEAMDTSGEERVPPPNTGVESRYLLILVESLSVLSIILDEFGRNQTQQPQVVFGSRFKDDVSYTTVCRNIYRIKTCMDMGRPVILLNMDELYESLYDALNQYFSTWGDKKFVDLGLGTHRVKAFVDDRFRLVVIADKNKVHSQFPIPLINRLEKHYISATSLLTARQKDVKNKLEAWAHKFVKPQIQFKKTCPSECDGCGLNLDQPYQLPCLLHFVGACCREAMFRGDMERRCPAEGCGQEIPEEHEWNVDKNALENRQYFENSQVETAFIGYSNETTALTVRTATEEVRPDHDDMKDDKWDQVLEKAKYHLLQCATGESVLRLDKTELKNEAAKIQNTYMRKQKHENLHEYLHHVLQKADSPQYIQVTTFAELMTENDKHKLQDLMCGGDQRVEIQNVYLKEFLKEDHFTETVRGYYEERTDSTKIILLQCELANENTELLDSVRYILDHESMAAYTQAHTVLLLNLPRGHKFVGYQGGKWRCLHIDDPRTPEIRLPSLSSCMRLKPDMIIDKLISRIDRGAAAEPAQAAAESMDTGDDDTEYDGLHPFIIKCLPAALSVIRTDHHYDRVELLKRLLTNNAEFTKTFLSHVRDLLEKQYEYSQQHWVKSDAAKASNMKQSETLRHALEDSLERAFIPGLAAVISFIDVRGNMRMIGGGAQLNPLWLRLFSECDKLGLKFSQIASSQAGAKLPNTYKIQEFGHGRQQFETQFPFSWIVKLTIDKFIAAKDPQRDTALSTLVEQFRSSSIGQIIHHPDFAKLQKMAFDSYLVDYIHMTHPCSSLAEHNVVGVNIMRFIQTVMKEKNPTMVHIHMAYEKQRETMLRLSSVYNLISERQIDGQDKKVKQKVERSQKRSDLVLLEMLLTLVQEIKIPDVMKDQESWVNTVERCKTVYTQIMEPSEIDPECEIVSHCREMWGQLELKKLYVEHVIIPVNQERDTKNTFNLRSLIDVKVKEEGFSSYEGFEEIVSFLRKTVSDELRALYPNCPKKCLICEEVIDSPVKLNCGHFLCDSCVREATICTQDNCGQTIDEDFKFDPLNAKIEDERLDSFKSLRARLNAFFMHFVSEIVFKPDSSPDDQIMEWLLERITSDNTTRKLSLFNSQEVVDPSPVLRSFLLKLLLKCEQSDSVENQLNNLLASWKDEHQLQVQTMVLFMDCHKDLYAVNQQQTSEQLCTRISDHHTLQIVTQHVDTLTLDMLRQLADIQIIINLITDIILNLPQDTPDRRLESCFREFLVASNQSDNLQINYLVVRQLLAIGGESHVTDLINSPMNYLIPAIIKRSLETFTVPDVLSLYGGDSYKTAKQDLENSFVHFTKRDKFAEALETIKTQTNDNVMLWTIFTRITRTMVSKSPVSRDIRDAIRTTARRNLANNKQVMLDLMMGDHLPPEMNLKQSRGVNLSMLVLHMFRCMNGGEDALGDINPLAVIVNNPQQAGNHFFPTMPDNQFEIINAGGLNVGASYKCPNGHPYFIGDCGRPVQRTLCPIPGCNQYIGSTGQYGQSAEGNKKVQTGDSSMKSKPGHLLGGHSARSGPLPERELSSLSCAILRFLTHLSMYTGMLLNRQAVRACINPNQPGDTVLGEFIDKHIQLDLKHISQCCSESTDDCLLLIHDIINNMIKAAGNRGADQVLTTIALRQQWEKQFNDKYIKPTLDSKTTVIKEMSEKLKSGDQVDIKDLLNTKINPIDPDNMLASPGIWDYNRPLTLPRVQNRQQAEREPYLRRVVEQCDKLAAVRFLPDVLQLNLLLNDRFHSKFTREDTKREVISRFCREQGAELTNIGKLVESFISAWNTIRTFMGGEMPAMTDESPLVDFLYDQHAPVEGHVGRKPYILVECLTTIQNAMIPEEDSEMLPLALVRPSHVITLSGGDELLNLITSHSEYELSGETSKDYDWSSIERQVVLRYIQNKPRIQFNKDAMIHYVYQEDFNLHNQIKAIDESQERLTDKQQKAITGSLVNAPIATLTDYLKNLTVTINFLSTLPHIEREVTLYKYMRTTLGHRPAYLPDDVTLKHVRDVWLVIKYAQVESLINREQETFDDIIPDCREPLTPALITSLDAAILLNSPSTRILLREMFKYIILRLNKAAIKQEPEEKARSLKDALNEFIYHRANAHDEDRAMEITYELPQLPEEIEVQHTAKVWSHIWQRCHMWLKDQ